MHFADCWKSCVISWDSLCRDIPPRYKNIPQMSFDDTGKEPEQAFRLNRDPNAQLEYPTKWISFNEFLSQAPSAFERSRFSFFDLQDRPFFQRPAPLHPHLEELWCREHPDLLHRPQGRILWGQNWSKQNLQSFSINAFKLNNWLIHLKPPNRQKKVPN